MWIPDKQSQKPDILATSGDCLHIWKVADDNSVSSIAKLKNVYFTSYYNKIELQYRILIAINFI